MNPAVWLPFTLGHPLKGQDIGVMALGNPDRGKELDLPFAEKEAEVIKRYFPQTLVETGGQADEDHIYNRKNKDVIHLASHANFDQHEPSRSKILLSESEKHDGLLTVEDIINSKFNTNLFTLSACETGLGKIQDGDEIISFNRALFLSGAKSIISTLWRINDVASAIIMKRFYRALSEGKSKAVALRTAQLNAKKFFPHPAYWSSFRLIGSPD